MPDIQVQQEEHKDNYIESEDEDYDPSAKLANNNDENGDEDEDFEDSEDEHYKKELKKYSSVESSSGGLVKTRRQREQELLSQKEKQFDLSTTKKSSSLDINSLWAQMNQRPKSNSTTPPADNKSSSPSNSSLETSGPVPSPQNATEIKESRVKIKRTYEFAGEMVTEEKWVNENSEEARAHFNSTTIKNDSKSTDANTTSSTFETIASNSSVKKRPPKRKRASLLDAVINNSSKTKLSTLEKSRLDWANYVDKNKINDELKFNNKGGYLDQQDFLNRVDARQDGMYKDVREKSKKQDK